MIEFLLPSGVSDFDAALRGILAKPLLKPFNDLTVTFINSVSRSIFENADVKKYPELAATAHWMRKAHLGEMQKTLRPANENGVLLARGMAFHIAPANVDSMFLYSWFLSLLAGNSNIVRISKERTGQVHTLLQILDRQLAKPEFTPLRERNLILSYEHDETVSERVSSVCHIRVLWGGDRTINTLRAVPLDPLATELVFPDRFSCAAIDARSVEELNEKALQSLVHAFYVDSFWFGQMACSSPRLVIWCGTRQVCSKAKLKLWSALDSHLKELGFEYPESVGIDKLTAICAYAGQGVVTGVTGTGTETAARANVDLSSSGLRTNHCGGGLFLEAECADLRDLAHFSTARDQTLSYFGFSHDQLTALLEQLPSRAIERMVPIGKALEFSPVWDGQNLLYSFCREVTVIPPSKH